MASVDKKSIYPKQKKLYEGSTNMDWRTQRTLELFPILFQPIILLPQNHQGSCDLCCENTYTQQLMGGTNSPLTPQEDQSLGLL